MVGYLIILINTFFHLQNYFLVILELVQSQLFLIDTSIMTGLISSMGFYALHAPFGIIKLLNCEMQ